MNNFYKLLHDLTIGGKLHDSDYLTRYNTNDQKVMSIYMIHFIQN